MKLMRIVMKNIPFSCVSIHKISPSEKKLYPSFKINFKIFTYAPLLVNMQLSI